MSLPEPTMQVATLKSFVGETTDQRIFELKICMWAGKSVTKFTDLPEDAQQVLKDWIGPGPNVIDARTGGAWKVDALPCPDCGNRTLMGYLLTNEFGEHMHTKYVCTFWKADPMRGTPRTETVTRPCGWQGWSVPGWDKQDD